MRSGLAVFSECQGSCGIVPNGLIGSVVSFNICQVLKGEHVASNYVTTGVEIATGYQIFRT